MHLKRNLLLEKQLKSIKRKFVGKHDSKCILIKIILNSFVL